MSTSHRSRVFLLIPALILSVALVPAISRPLVAAAQPAGITVCGQVSGYTAPSGGSTGSVTVGSTMYTLASTFTAPTGFTNGAVTCFTPTFNGLGQVTSATIANEPATICGVVSNFSANSVQIGNTLFTIASGATITGTVTNGANRCFANTYNSSGQISTATVTSNVTTAPTLTISKSVDVNSAAGSTGFASSQTALPGNTVLYRIDFANTSGTTAAAAVTITDKLSAGQTFVEALDANGNVITSGCTFTMSSSTLSCSIGSLGAGASGHFYIVTVLNSNATGSITNAASITQTFNGATTTPVTSNSVTVTITTTVPTTVPMTICGIVTAYTPASAVGATTASTGSIVINGVTLTIAAGASVSGTVTINSNQCLTLTFTNGQVTSITVSQNLPAVALVCGVVTTVSTGTMTINGIAFPVVTTFPVTIVTTQVSCFLLSTSGQITGILSVIPTSAHLATMHHEGRVGRMHAI